MSHLQESFTQRFDELFQSSQIIAIEFADANGEQEQEAFWNAVSRGEQYVPTTMQSQFSEFTRELLERLISTNKMVDFERSPVKKKHTKHRLLLAPCRSKGDITCSEYQHHVKKSRGNSFCQVHVPSKSFN